MGLNWTGHGIAFDLGENYAVEAEFGRQIRDWKDGVTFWNWTCNLDLFQDDHKPSFEFRLELLNWTLFGIDIYNVRHLSPEEEQHLYPSD